MNKLLNNNRGQKIFVSMMISVMAIIVLLIIVSPLRVEIQKATNGTFSSLLNSSNPDISIVHQATVVIIDMSLFYFVGVLVAISICYITGRQSFVGIITAIMVFVVTSILISPLKNLIILARDSTHLNCAAATISVGQKLSCIVTSIWLFYFVVACISAAAVYFTITTVVKPK